ncbi:hypothetical protein FIU88_00135 [Halomonas sp. THAF12]|uniref:bifunctional glycoside hydrolase 114/ polysaccharide deacetylase family protein n=1 Tax=Halomonas sp. THAF12 TaxID=2587849 RepID=UPI0012A8D28D|nr:bifunctional glycoside hydrolase 114/ polysaccharide deacetylase family protein [Halomonas sp. THAF12]QFT83372.1 hypothetical protein FIU88_00135 [Halomonas sp. THAF12]
MRNIVGLLFIAIALTALPDTARAVTPDGASSPSVAFYYGNDAPLELLDQFDWVAIEAANLAPRQRERLERHGTQAFAYVSVGELDAWRPQPSHLPDSVLLEDNPHWNSRVADLTSDEWQRYLLEERIQPLWNDGYRGLFLDTLDSYRLFAPEGRAARRQQQALVELIGEIRQRFPDMKLLVNRGFEVLDRIHGDIVGIAAESLYRRWNPATGIYGSVPDTDSQWLHDQLSRARDEYGLPTIAIDYVPAADRALARRTAERIAAEGFIPWVSVAQLNQVGVGLIEPVPRRILMLYDKASTEAGELANTNAHRYLAMPLEYMGYAAEYHDVNAALPDDVLNGRYAGIVSWFDGPIPDGQRYADWLLEQMRDGLRVVILGDPGIPLNGALGNHMGLIEGSEQRQLRIADHDDMLGFEGMPSRPAPYQHGYQTTRADIIPHLTLEAPGGRSLSPVLSGPWGGIATWPWILQQAGEAQQRWILDPFAFLETALALPEIPVPDPTTENGARYWMTQIDGDAFVSRADFPGSHFTGELMLTEVLQRYRVPTTVSVIEGEFGPHSMHPHLRSQLEPLARRIFELPWVEMANHTFSHPFQWEKLDEGDLAGQGETQTGFNYNLPIPGYAFSLEREIAGATAYINDHLAPPDKSVSVVLWSGNALPPEEALAHAERIGLRNMNGGNTHITDSFPTLTRVSPMLRPQGDYLQVYAPQTNENIYTNHMRGPLWGYRRVIETYRLTDRPRRLKPIDIYYHFYSAASPAALKALQQVYDYVSTQETLPVYTSTWSDVASQWYDLGIARRLDGGWQIRAATRLRTLRLPRALGWPDLAASRGVAGVRDTDTGRYVALSGAGDSLLQLSPRPPETPHLRLANGRISRWEQHDAKRLSLRLAAEQVSLRIELAGMNDCDIDAPGARQQQQGDRVILSYAGSHSDRIEVSCDD